MNYNHEQEQNENGLVFDIESFYDYLSKVKIHGKQKGSGIR